MPKKNGASEVESVLKKKLFTQRDEQQRVVGYGMRLNRELAKKEEN